MNGALFSSAPVEWETPQGFFDRLDMKFEFTLDPCATSDNAKCARFFTKVEDGLAQPWDGVVFVNPPYGRVIGKWVCKAYKESQRGAVVVMLIPSRTSTRWWHDWVMKASELWFVKGRLRFGGASENAPFPSVVVVFRPGMHGPPLVSAVV